MKDLSSILKGHEGEIFYCSLYGQNVKLKKVTPTNIILDLDGIGTFSLYNDGSYRPGGELQLFPRDQRNWDEWEEGLLNIPKVWRDIKPDKNYPTFKAELWIAHDGSYQNYRYMQEYGDSSNRYDRSAMAFFKIILLIEKGYGGLPGNDEIRESKFAIIKYDFPSKKFIVQGFPGSNIKLGVICFKNVSLAKEFLKYWDNIRLLEEYWML